jgi:hypothetical protein
VSDFSSAEFAKHFGLAIASNTMKARFADLSARVRQPNNRDIDEYEARERRQVLALCDAVQIAVAKAQRDRVHVLLKEMHAIVDAALARRSGMDQCFRD